ncbi:hypothetical protein LJC48_03470 [Desulfovibrio sp. OttesenSCG-928-C06]|nr:hypothetical protein [Desulfovibrio sp. OttesenSCG-928-C06]
MAGGNAMFTVPAMVTQNISRAKGYIRRNEIRKALETLTVAVEMFQPDKIVGKARYETEIHLQECVEDLSKHPRVHGFLKTVTKSKEPSIKYSAGGEEALSKTLRVIHKVLTDQDEEIAMMEGDTNDMRREGLWEKGTKCLADGNNARGKAYLRRMGEEFGHEEGVLTKIGEVMVDAGLWYEAAEMLEESMSKFHKDPKTFSLLIKCYTELREYEQAERLYVKALRQFGQHPTTLLNFATMYRAWNKRDECFRVCQQAQKLDPDNKEIQTLINWAERIG